MTGSGCFIFVQAFEPYKARALESSLNIESNIDELVPSWSEGQPLVFQVGFDTMPEVTWVSSYKELTVRHHTQPTPAACPGTPFPGLYSLLIESPCADRVRTV